MIPMASLSPSNSWNIACAQVQGESHAHLNIPCQDAVCWEESLAYPGHLIIAMADGAGSVRFGGEGAQIAVDASVRFFKSIAPGDSATFKRQSDLLISHIQKLLHEKAKEKSVLIHAFATTLLVFVLDPEKYFGFQIGDGFAVLKESQEDSVYKLVLPPQQGEHANETTFVTDAYAVERAIYCIGSKAPHFLAMGTDGISSVALDIRKDFAPHAPFFDPLAQFILEEGQDANKASQKIEGFLKSPRFAARTQDDRTLFLFSQKKEEVS